MLRATKKREWLRVTLRSNSEGGKHQIKAVSPSHEFWFFCICDELMIEIAVRRHQKSEREERNG
jgi:hypothetical protein